MTSKIGSVKMILNKNLESNTLYMKLVLITIDLYIRRKSLNRQ